MEGGHSGWTEVCSGIPQGSVLGPILFLIFINNLPNAVKSSTKFFADDTKLYRGVSDSHYRSLLQGTLMHWKNELRNGSFLLTKTNAS